MTADPIPRLPGCTMCFVKFVETTTGMRDLIAFSEDGKGLATSLEPMPEVNASDRDYFVFHRNNASTRPVGRTGQCKTAPTENGRLRCRAEWTMQTDRSAASS